MVDSVRCIGLASSIAYNTTTVVFFCVGGIVQLVCIMEDGILRCNPCFVKRISPLYHFLVSQVTFSANITLVEATLTLTLRCSWPS